MRNRSHAILKRNRVVSFMSNIASLSLTRTRIAARGYDLSLAKKGSLVMSLKMTMTANTRMHTNATW